VPKIDENAIYQVLSRICLAFKLELDEVGLNQGIVEPGDNLAAPLECLQTVGRRVGIHFQLTSGLSVSDLRDLAADGSPLVMLDGDELVVVEQIDGLRTTVSRVGQEVVTTQLGKSELRQLVRSQRGLAVLVARQDLECSTLTEHSAGSSSKSAARMSPRRRLWALLKLDLRDILLIAVFAIVTGMLTLATPLAVESLVNVVSWGAYSQPLIVIGIMLLACLGIAGILKILQTVVVEVIQQRQMVRLVGDLAHRFPRAVRSSLIGKYPREFANRVFDITTIQKATAVLLLDGISIVLTTVFGLLLLAFYHPFLLGFDIVLLSSMVFITWILGRGGIKTAIVESGAKYKIVHWLQDVISFPAAFQINGGENLAIEKANRLASDYVAARQRQFAVLIRQVTFAIMLQVVASTSVLVLGGYLVQEGELTLGQLVASELVVTVVVGSFAKAGKSIEKFYDLMAGIDKVGYLLDLPVEPRRDHLASLDDSGTLRWRSVVVEQRQRRYEVPDGALPVKSSLALVGDDTTARSLFARSCAGLTQPARGIVEYSLLDCTLVTSGRDGKTIGYAGEPEILHLSIEQNVALDRLAVGPKQVRDSLQKTGMWSVVSGLPDGLQTQLQSDGFPLSRIESQLVCLARILAGPANLIVVDHLLDDLPDELKQSVLEILLSESETRSVVISTRDKAIAERCSQQLEFYTTSR
jgi:putative ABC transport system ATP-binding protein